MFIDLKLRFIKLTWSSCQELLLVSHLDVPMCYGRRLCVHVGNGACHLIEDAQDNWRIEWRIIHSKAVNQRAA